MFNKIKFKGSIKKKIIVISIICIIGIVCYSVCSMKRSIRTESIKIVEVMESGNIEMLEKLLLGIEDFTEDNEWIDFSINIPDENDGIITKIVEQSSIDIKKITKEYIVYEIIAPELSDIFKEAMQEENLTENNFEEYIYHYIANAEKINTEVEISYSYENGVFKADYLTKEFINGIINIFHKYQTDNNVIFDFHTEMYIGKV